MDLGLTEEQQMLREFARDFMEKECSEQYVRDMEEDPTGYLPEVWRKMAEQGWMALIVPEEYGGVGMTFLDLMVLVEEFGRAIVPGPYIPTVTATIPPAASPTPDFEPTPAATRTPRPRSASPRRAGAGCRRAGRGPAGPRPR